MTRVYKIYIEEYLMSEDCYGIIPVKHAPEFLNEKDAIEYIQDNLYPGNYLVLPKWRKI